MFNQIKNSNRLANFKIRLDDLEIMERKRIKREFLETSKNGSVFITIVIIIMIIITIIIILETLGDLLSLKLQ